VNTYACFYKRQKIEVKAATTAEAQRSAQAVLKLTEKQRPGIAVVLAAIGTEPYTQSTNSL
jgi:hypothetical protein